MRGFKCGFFQKSNDPGTLDVYEGNRERRINTRSAGAHLLQNVNVARRSLRIERLAVMAEPALTGARATPCGRRTVLLFLKCIII